MKINFDKIEEKTGITTKNPIELIYYLTNSINYLESHNKNYTKKQYFYISELKDIIQSIEIYND